MHVLSGSALDQGTHTIAVLPGVAVVTYMLQRSHVLTVAPTLFFSCGACWRDTLLWYSHISISGFGVTVSCL